MPFSTAFATGIEIGRSSRKQRAISKAFEAMKSLDHVEEQATPSPNVQALPTEQAGEGMVAALNPQTAIPTDTPAPTKVSLSKVDLDNFESIAMEAARASGDLSVYSALNSMMTQKLQTKLLNGLRGAQVALLNGDTATAEKALRRANYYVPNGQDINIRKDDQGQLIWTSPMSGKEEPVTPKSIGMIQAAALDPMRFTSMLTEMQKNAADAANDAQRTANDTARTDASVAESAQRVASSKSEDKRRDEELKIKQDELDDALKTGKISRLNLYSEIAYRDRLSSKAAAEAKNAANIGGMKDADAIKMADEVAKRTGDFFNPPTRTEEIDPYTKQPTGAFKMSPGETPAAYADWTPEDKVQASSVAQSIGIANPELGTDGAVRAGVELVRRFRDGGTIQKADIDLTTSVIRFDMDGQPTQIYLPRAVAESFGMPPESPRGPSTRRKGSSSKP